MIAAHMTIPPLGYKVGILGGGQLAAMLAEAAIRLGLRPVVLAKGPLDPAARLVKDALFGSYEDLDLLKKFLGEVELVAFENEFIPSELLQQARHSKTHFMPELETLRRLQDKISQKRALQSINVPTAPMIVLDDRERVQAWLEKVDKDYQSRFVLKWSRTGYDGKGVYLAGSEEPLARRREPLGDFAKAAIERGSSVFAEPYVPFKRELALVACQSTSGEFASYPLVIIEQPKGVCRWVKGPAVALGTNPALEGEAQKQAKQIAQAFQLQGTFAVEFFELEDGSLWVNEISPRVHNSGHFTQDAATTSQFENHWRALLGLPLGEMSTHPAFAMLNVLGPQSAMQKHVWRLPPITARLHLHWYNKADLLPGRKLGHINGHVRDVQAFADLIAEMERCERGWIDG
jgi:5-(carboxyamino)imidazole ribonucleotide synthase